MHVPDEDTRFESSDDKLIGRPTIYSLDFAKKICDVIARTPKGVRRICKDNPWMPDYSTIKDWDDKKPEFSALYTDAKKKQVSEYAAQTLDIADEAQELAQVYIDAKSASALVNAAKLRCDVRHWYAGKLAPRIYGAKAEELPKEEPETLSDEQKFKRIQEIMAGGLAKAAEETKPD